MGHLGEVLSSGRIGVSAGLGRHERGQREGEVGMHVRPLRNLRISNHCVRMNSSCPTAHALGVGELPALSRRGRSAAPRLTPDAHVVKLELPYVASRPPPRAGAPPVLLVPLWGHGGFYIWDRTQPRGESAERGHQRGQKIRGRRFGALEPPYSLWS